MLERDQLAIDKLTDRIFKNLQLFGEIEIHGTPTGWIIENGKWIMTEERKTLRQRAPITQPARALFLIFHSQFTIVHFCFISPLGCTRPILADRFFCREIAPCRSRGPSPDRDRKSVV